MEKNMLKIQFKVYLDCIKKTLAPFVDNLHILQPSRLHGKGCPELLNSLKIQTQHSQ